MNNQKLRGKDLRKIGYLDNKLKSLSINIITANYKYLTKKEKLELLISIKDDPKSFLEDEVLGAIAEEFLDIEEEQDFVAYDLKEESIPYKVYGKQFIDQNTINQMDLAMRLPITKKGALMPDAHVGYGLPIGGVLATKNEIIPYGIGLDIGCRMALSIFDLPISYAKKNAYLLKTSLKEHTHFGIGTMRSNNQEHEILDDGRFQDSELLRNLHGKANLQLGTSGSGNHFVEFGEVELDEENDLNLPAGNYLGLLSHSGSRGFGATVAQYYTQVAMDVCRLPKGSQNLAWLDMDKEEGQAYWHAMNLAGDYAKANHDVIHDRLSKAIGAKTLLKIENHHNFAWKEIQEDGEELIVHRKGATPAKEGELGIIPSSMSTTGYIVSGKGKPNSLNSASHGAGRKYSRNRAKQSFTKSQIDKILRSKGITLIGGGVDEAPMAYKDIKSVINSQLDLIKIEGAFTPIIVRMNKG